MVKPPKVGSTQVEYVVAFTPDHADCIICPKAYLDGHEVTALHTRKPYPIVKVFMADSGEEAMRLGMQILHKNLSSTRPV